ncbi:helix-turn-helix domain-containing protein [Actinacidiphila paucisporea]|uniref:Helix-turn-helix domain-containing protein n=1 Tax=Actinacidiphila paucisporea TaxID=310782 RepID=A0A1M6VC00_9ACTN|nr:helix-turn-helix transcriptional regulator [Actinacidiphila paucisporea]SHK79000.1 Helix-turn-helix domain-containing protein [Actinacidiphila paucisporea]
MTANGTGGGGTGAGGEPESSDSLRTFGAFVQALREHAGLSREEFGGLIGLSKHTVTSIEVGRRMPDPDFVERAEPLLGNTGALRNAVRHLNRGLSWASWFRQWAKKEQTAINLDTYECRFVPGLLQTEAYARALFEERLPPLSDEEIDTQWTARAERQKLLRERPNTSFSFVLDEHVLLRRTGGPEATRKLIDHVLEVSQCRNIEIQVLPLGTGVHPGLNGPIQLLETPENKWLAYGEGQGIGQLISDSKLVSILQMRYAKLRSQALSPEESRSLLLRLRGEL